MREKRCACLISRKRENTRVVSRAREETGLSYLDWRKDIYRRRKGARGWPFILFLFREWAVVKILTVSIMALDG